MVDIDSKCKSRSNLNNESKIEVHWVQVQNVLNVVIGMIPTLSMYVVHLVEKKIYTSKKVQKKRAVLELAVRINQYYN